MKPAAPTAKPDVNRWLLVLGAAAVAFLATTLYAFVQALHGSPKTPPARHDAPAAASPQPVREVGGHAHIVINNFLPAQVVRVPPAAPNASANFVTKKQAHQQAVHTQAQYLRQISRQYPNSPLWLSSADIDKMEKEGRLAQ